MKLIFKVQLDMFWAPAPGCKNEGFTQLFYSYLITLLCHAGNLRRREKIVYILYVFLSMCSHVHAQSMLHFYILFLHIFLKMVTFIFHMLKTHDSCFCPFLLCHVWLFFFSNSKWFPYSSRFTHAEIKAFPSKVTWAPAWQWCRIVLKKSCHNWSFKK